MTARSILPRWALVLAALPAAWAQLILAVVPPRGIRNLEVILVALGCGLVLVTFWVIAWRFSRAEIGARGAAVWVTSMVALVLASLVRPSFIPLALLTLVVFVLVSITRRIRREGLR